MSNLLEDDVLEYINSNNLKLYQALWKIMDLEDMSVKELARYSYLSKEQIYRYLTDGGIKRFKIGNIVAFCVAMHVPPKVSKKLIQLSGCPYKPSGSVIDRRYQYILKKAPMWTMDDANNYIDRINATITEDHLSHLPNEKTYQRHLKLQEG